MSKISKMQAFNQKYDYGKRAGYQVSRLETTYLEKGAHWEKAPQVYQITVLDFNYAPKSGGNVTTTAAEAPVSRYALRTTDGRELTDSLNVIFIELPKTALLEESVETNTPLENWAVFLKNADNPAKQGIIEKLVKKEAGLMQARESLSSISGDKELWIAQYRQEMIERDIRSGLSAARQEGIQEGIQEGVEKGIKIGEEKGIKIGEEKGSQKKGIQIAKKYMALGHSAEEAAAFAEIDVAELR